MSRKIDLTGQRFGRLVVIRESERNKRNRKMWECRCDCGNIKIVLGNSLKTGNTHSCGCLKNETTAKINMKHNLCKSSEYKIWGHMIQRCTNPNNPAYKNYGDREIMVCERWRNSFEAFYEAMGSRPGIEFSIDRINNNLGYNKNNCRWIVKIKQNQNQRNRKDNTSGKKGINWNKQRKKWVARITIDRKRISLGAFNSLNEAVEARRIGEIQYWEK